MIKLKKRGLPIPPASLFFKFFFVAWKEYVTKKEAFVALAKHLKLEKPETQI